MYVYVYRWCWAACAGPCASVLRVLCVWVWVGGCERWMYTVSVLICCIHLVGLMSCVWR
jgi:hypothetical protein